MPLSSHLFLAGLIGLTSSSISNATPLLVWLGYATVSWERDARGRDVRTETSFPAERLGMVKEEEGRPVATALGTEDVDRAESGAVAGAAGERARELLGVKASGAVEPGVCTRRRLERRRALDITEDAVVGSVVVGVAEGVLFGAAFCEERQSKARRLDRIFWGGNDYASVRYVRASMRRHRL